LVNLCIPAERDKHGELIRPGKRSGCLKGLASEITKGSGTELLKVSSVSSPINGLKFLCVFYLCCLEWFV